MGLGAFALFKTNSFLAGCVVNARVEQGVKLPNLYAAKTECKTATLFNAIQRGHQNFLEQLPGLALSMLLMNTIVIRPNLCGMIMVIASLARIGYARGYTSQDVQNRIPFVLLSMFAQAVGVGYAGLAALTLVGVKSVDLER